MPGGTPVYVNNAVLDINAFSILPGLELPPAKAKPDVFVVDFTAENIATRRSGVGIVDARMQGTVNITQISSNETDNDEEEDDDDRDEDNERWTGTGDVAVLLKGVAIYDSLNDYTLAGSGMISAVLDPVWTTRANDSAIRGVFDDVVAGIKTVLRGQGLH